MSRTTRPFQPGSAYHLTTRSQGRVPLFTPALRYEIVSILEETLRHIDVLLLAFSIMPNHLHLVVKHGFDPMGKLMQRLLSRVARRTQKRHGLEGHIFERRYRHRACLNPRHLRNAIAYTNLNAVRAGMCSSAEEYVWSSAGVYAGQSPNRLIDQMIYRPYWLFCTDGTAGEDSEAYRDYLAWRLERDRLTTSGLLDPNFPMKSRVPRRVRAQWAIEFPTFFEPAIRRVENREDLRDIARRTLREYGPHLTLSAIRNRRGPQHMVDIRWRMIQRMSAEGYPGSRIAEFFGMAKSSISHVLSSTWQCESNLSNPGPPEAPDAPDAPGA